MNYLLGTVIFNCLASPHHMGMGMGMGTGLGIGFGMGSAGINEENNTFVFDTNDTIYNITNNSTNITDVESESGIGNGSDNSFNMAIGFGASFGIIAFIISILAIREKKNREYNNNNEIYLEPVSEIEIETKNNDSHVLVVNENYNCEEGDGEHQYETICDTLYELAGEKSSH